MSQANVTFSESFAVPPEVLWAAMADHEGMGEWLDADIRVVAGPEGGGVGTVRRISMPGGASLDEEVTYSDAPRRMVYRIVRGAPGVRFHRGEILVEPWGDHGSQLRWDILIDSAVPGLPHLMLAPLRPAIRKGLANLRQRFAAAA